MIGIEAAENWHQNVVARILELRSTEHTYCEQNYIVLQCSN